MSRLQRLKTWARFVKRDVVALWFAARDPRTPRSAKIGAALVAAYALSPIDLIPDFIPVIGHLDDLILVPVGIAIVVRLIPAPLMSEFRTSANLVVQRPISRVAAVIFVLLWISMAVLPGLWIISWLAAARGPR